LNEDEATAVQLGDGAHEIETEAVACCVAAGLKQGRRLGDPLSTYERVRDPSFRRTAAIAPSDLRIAEEVAH